MSTGTFEYFIAKRYLLGKKKGFISVTSLFSLIGLWLGVSALIITMSVMNGFRHEFIGRILGINGHLGVYGRSGTLAGYEQLKEQVEKTTGVTLVMPMIEQQVMASSSGNSRGAMLRAMHPEDMAKRKMLRDGLKGGTFTDLQGKNTIILGYRLAEKMGLTPGDEITMISPEGEVTAFGSIPKMAAFKIVGTFDVGMHEYDANFMFTSLENAQNFFGMDDAITNLEVFVDDLNKAPERAMDIQEVVGNKARVYDWQRSNAAFFNAIQVERNVLFLILTLIILVAAFNIISSLHMLVKEKTRDIAILRTMGASKGQIMRVFMLAGSLIGFTGTTAGIVTSLLFCKYIDNIKRWLESLSGNELFSAEIYFLSKLPAKVEPGEVVLVAVMAFALSFLATIYPAFKAARMDPVEGLYA